MKEFEKPILVIPLESFRQMFAYVDLCKGEVTWWFDVDFDIEKNAFIVGKVYLLNQEATGGHVEMEEEDIAKFMNELMEMNVDQMPRGWGHSHVDFAAFFSGVDDGTIEQLENESFLIALVVNKNREMQCDLMINAPQFRYRIEDLEVRVDYTDAGIPEELVKEVKEKVKEKKWTNLFDKKKGRKKWEYDEQEFSYGNPIYFLTLPRDREEALKRVKEYNLSRVYDPETEIVYWQNSETGAKWKDAWGSLSKEAEEFKKLMEKHALKPKKEKTLPLLAAPETILKCATCQYLEEYHNSSLCETPVWVNFEEPEYAET